MTGDTYDRRSLLKATGTALAATVAGCGGSPGENGEGNTNVPGRIDNYLSGSPEVGNYDGTWEDHTGESEVVIKVGGAGNGNNQAFVPAAFKVSVGTTVEWHWTGQGGFHNVVSAPASDVAFDSGEPKTDRDPFRKRFETTGFGLYYCEPHRSIGMKGGFEVV